MRPVSRLKRTGESAVLTVDLGPLAEGVRMGDSVSIDGACLTVVELSGARAAFDLSAETLRLTTLGRANAGTLVNVERALKLGDRLGGHFVQGHVDGIATVAARRDEPGQTVVRLSGERELMRSMIMKGSVAVDGISLTISGLGEDWFEVTLIPHTLQMTTMSYKKAGNAVNVEADMIGKWVRRIIEGRTQSEEGLTIEKLQSEGFA